LFANVYLNYVLAWWVDWWRNTRAHGAVIIVRYADDFIVWFEDEQDARRFLDELRERLAKFGLELHRDKTRLIEFGRHAGWKRAKRGLGKAETFDFLGFTHICGKSRKGGRFWVKRVTIAKRMRAKLREIKVELKRRMHEAVPVQGQWLRSLVAGHLAYYARARQHRHGGGLPDPGDAALVPGDRVGRSAADPAPGRRLAGLACGRGVVRVVRRS